MRQILSKIVDQQCVNNRKKTLAEPGILQVETRDWCTLSNVQAQFSLKRTLQRRNVIPLPRPISPRRIATLSRYSSSP